MIKAFFLPRLMVLALIITSCSIEIDQTTDTPPPPSTESIQSTLPNALLPTTRIPVTWAHLNLTGRLIYLSSTREDDIVNSNIQMLDLASGDIATIFSIPRAWIYYLTISPDTKSMVMSYAPPTESNSSPNRILYIMPLYATIAPRPLFTPPTPDDHYTQAEWSPDGKYIYYVHYNSKNRPEGQLDPVYDLFRMKYPDGQPEKIAASAFWPRLSPDDSKLVYVSVDPASGKNELFLANADGSNTQQVAFADLWTQEIFDAPIFSPDGQSILFSVPTPAPSSQRNWFEKLLGIQVAQAHNVPSDWWSVPVAGGTPTQLTNIQTINLFASISPDEKYVASVSGEGLFVMDLNGSSLIQLVFDPNVHGTVSWIP
jgi:Tol biopolymer transport system component